MQRREIGTRTGNYAPGLVVEGGRTVFLSGCVAEDAQGNIVGKGDLGAQARQAFANMAALLAEAGGSLKDVVKLTTFVVPMERFGEFAAVRRELFAPDFPASSTVGVTALASPDYLIEIEAIAVIG
jgi:enamine deaminase RidA (YjgF/YER057c/UK114 family)